MWQTLKALGYKACTRNGIYSDALVKPFEGSRIMNQTNILSLDTPGVNQMKADLDAVQPSAGSKADLGDVYGSASTDMFVDRARSGGGERREQHHPVLWEGRIQRRHEVDPGDSEPLLAKDLLAVAQSRLTPWLPRRAPDRRPPPAA
jgi:hypothetical protein